MGGCPPRSLLQRSTTGLSHLPQKILDPPSCMCALHIHVDGVCVCVFVSVKTRSGPSTYISESDGSLFLWIMLVTRKADDWFIFLKMVTIDSECLSTSDCHSSDII